MTPRRTSRPTRTPRIVAGLSMVLALVITGSVLGRREKDTTTRTPIDTVARGHTKTTPGHSYHGFFTLFKNNLKQALSSTTIVLQDFQEADDDDEVLVVSSVKEQGSSNALEDPAPQPHLLDKDTLPTLAQPPHEDPPVSPSNRLVQDFGFDDDDDSIPSDTPQLLSRYLAYELPPKDDATRQEEGTLKKRRTLSSESKKVKCKSIKTRAVKEDKTTKSTEAHGALDVVEAKSTESSPGKSAKSTKFAKGDKSIGAPAGKGGKSAKSPSGDGAFLKAPGAGKGMKSRKAPGGKGKGNIAPNGGERAVTTGKGAKVIKSPSSPTGTFSSSKKSSKTGINAPAGGKGGSKGFQTREQGPTGKGMRSPNAPNGKGKGGKKGSKKSPSGKGGKGNNAPNAPSFTKSAKAPIARVLCNEEL